MNKQFVALFAALTLVSGAQAVAKEFNVQSNQDVILSANFSFGSDSIWGNISHLSHAMTDSLGNTELKVKANEAVVAKVKGSITGTFTGSDSLRVVKLVAKNGAETTTYKFETTILETKAFAVLDLSFDSNGKLTVSALDENGNVLATLVVRKLKTKVDTKKAAVAAVVAAQAKA
jgi:hypothetical protein